MTQRSCAWICPSDLLIWWHLIALQMVGNISSLEDCCQQTGSSSSSLSLRHLPTTGKFLFLFTFIKTFCWQMEQVASIRPSSSGQCLPAVIYLELFDHSGVSHNCQQLPTFCLSCKSKVSLHLNVQPLCGWSTVWSLGTKGTDASPSLVTATHTRRGSTSWRYLVFPFFQTCGRSNNKVLTGS